MKRFWITAGIIVLVILVLLLLWYCFPFLPRLIFGPSTYAGVSYYQDNSYLDFEHGERFCQFLADFGMTDRSKAVNFSYEDTFLYDHPKTGKYFDFYVADFACDTEELAELKEAVVEQSIDNPFEEQDYSIYILPVEEMSSDSVCFKAVAFCNNAQIVRFIMVPDKDNNSRITAWDAYYCITWWKQDIWKGQGDGLREPN